MPKIIDRAESVKKEIIAIKADPVFLNYIFDFFLRAGKTPIPDELRENLKATKKNLVCFRKTYFSSIPVENNRKTEKIYFWLAVSYMQEYFLEQTGKPRWRLIEGFLREKKHWGKTELKSKAYGRGNKILEDYLKHSYRPPLKDIKLLYGSYKKIEAVLPYCDTKADGTPSFYAALRIYKT